jgi:asparagine synthase (glutamine-hydrolysing)
MCGIAGIVSGAVVEEERSLRSMVDSLRHRGPDGSGVHLTEGCGLGHTRLSIVDLEGGKQPMLSPDGSMAVTFNGEIYGYQEIRRELTDYPFRDSSDTDVLLALFAKHGERMMPHLPGMFAFAIWDGRRRRLFAARDRFGEKPFFYAFGRRGEFVFASEIKAILASGQVEPVLSQSALAHYLRRGYVHPHSTIYENVHVLPPACALSYEPGGLRTWRYWTPAPARESIGLGEAVGEFRRLFERAVERQLVADVPVGAFLSGGLDSSSVVAAASRRKQRLRTLSFGFPGSDDELPFAAEVARECRTEHITMRAEDEDLGALLEAMQTVYDEPFADSSNVPTYLLCREARRHLKVVLTGDGGDELLGGYAWYRPLYWLERSRGTSVVQLVTARALLAFLDRCRIRRLERLRERSRGMVLAGRYASVAAAQRGENVFFSDREIGSFGLPAAEPGGGDVPAESAEDALAQAMETDLWDFMPGDILVKIDRASMAHGLELRAPFLDVDFAEFCLSLPSRFKLDGRQDKIILREAYSAEWPASVRGRGKQGFGAPIRDWLASAPIRSLIGRYLLDRSAPIHDLLRLSLNEHAIRESGHRGWILLVLSLWLAGRGSSPRSSEAGAGEVPSWSAGRISSATATSS